MRKLTNADIKDLREYERERDAFVAEIISLKKKRRIALGDLMTIVFENATTMRFQIQEMARAERMLRDEQISHEIETYNELVPDDGELERDALHRDHGRRRAARVAAQAHPHPEPHRDRGGRRDRRCGGDRPGAADPRGGDHLDGALPALLVHRRPARRLRGRPVAIVVEHSAYRARVELTEEQRNELIGDFAV